ncbi:MAG: LuxR C-terminal-related transcriptional regulator [Cyclobacteriaceae bacterium]
MEKNSILIADKQALTLAGLKSIIAELEQFEIVHELLPDEELIDAVERHRPTLLIADYNLAEFISQQKLHELHRAHGIKTLIITSDNNRNRIMQIARSGVLGFITKECSREEIIMAIQSTSRGERFFCHKVLDRVIGATPGNDNCEPTVLTGRETEILGLLAQGLSTQSIASVLNLSPHTVHTHRKNIIKKLSIKSPTEFVVHAIDFGLLPLPK